MTEDEKKVDQYFKDHFKSHFEHNSSMNEADYTNLIENLPEDKTQNFLLDKFTAIDKDRDGIISVTDVRKFFNEQLNGNDNDQESQAQNIKKAIDFVWENYEDQYT
jgi:Ca2+-binding EF-hand superfamily protein